MKNHAQRVSILDACQTFFYNCRRSSMLARCCGSAWVLTFSGSGADRCRAFSASWRWFLCWRVPCRAQQAAAKPGTADPAERRAGRGAEAGPQVPALARAQGDEAGQSDPGILEVLSSSSTGSFSTRRISIAARRCWRCRWTRLPAPDAREFGRLALAQVDAAARLDNPDWQILLKLRADGFETLLPDVQAMRTLGGRWRCGSVPRSPRAEFDDAIRTAKTMFAMARHLGEHPTLIGDLVGIAIAIMAINPLDEMLEQPGCPNLYWALTNLPDPFISIRTGIEGERLTLWAFSANWIRRSDECRADQEIHRPARQAVR